MSTTPSLATEQRLRSIDALRGLVILLMALDHTRDFWGITNFATEDPNRTTVGWFFTRWITHFCAPVFIFLTGLSAYLYGAKGRTKRAMSHYLVTRGLWLIFLEVTMVNLSWRFAIGDFVFLQVIWAIGASMVLLGGLIWLPRKAILGVAILLIAGHNALDTVTPGHFGKLSWVWHLLHVSGFIPISENFGIRVAYPIIPWCGVMALGYVLGPWFLATEDKRRRALLITGATMIGLFLILRYFNVYGDPRSWTPQSRGPLYTALSFLNTKKYPPSLLYLLMTLGPSLLLLAYLDRSPTRFLNFLSVFGRVPLFLYLLHLPVIRLTGTLKNQFLHGQTIDLFTRRQGWPETYTPRLWLVYLAWAALVILCFYPTCRWFGAYKRAHPDSWIARYL